MCTTSRQEATAWGPAVGAQKTVWNRRKWRVRTAGWPGQALPGLWSPSLHFQKSRLNTGAVVRHRKENTAESTLEKAEERKETFYLIFIRRKRTEEFSCVRNRRTAFLIVISWKSNILRGNYGNSLNVNCCASGRVCFLGGALLACACVCVHVCARWPSAPWRRVVRVSVELAWDSRAGKQLQSKASRSPGRHWSLGSPSNERGERFMLIALPREWLESQMLTLLLF